MILNPDQLRLTLVVFFNIMTACSLNQDVFAQDSLIELIEEKKRSIVTVQAQKIGIPGDQKTGSGHDLAVLERTGAGIIIDPTGYIVTNTHTILYSEYVYVILHDGNRLPAVIHSIAPETDFTILQIKPPYPLEALAWSDTRNITLGADIISVGNSALWKETICAGKITGIAKKISQDTVGLIEMDLELDRGDSGGPVLDRQGNFLGIIIAKNTRAARSSYAIPAADIRNYFLEHLKDHQP